MMNWNDLEDAVHPGDVVRTGMNLYPHYNVVFVDGDKAWVRDMASGSDSLASLAQCHRVEASPGLPYRTR